MRFTVFEIHFLGLSLFYFVVWLASYRPRFVVTILEHFQFELRLPVVVAVEHLSPDDKNRKKTYVFLNSLHSQFRLPIWQTNLKQANKQMSK